ncbi:Acyl carrier protein [Jannaschia seosinensis]|uniref:Acyl carrier protein n=1 Tax=Jannaschia seosinensis TaxID=313367 RepID=A0A0M7B928_9RHOB|nr:acyl carrier protein [Jannaschia seosinensis]CUH20927.1 Acyl carrier protein [Jannaschia seosinensis]
MSDIRARVHEILAEQAMVDVADISDDQVPADLGIDSMGVVEAIFALEEAFDIEIPFNANEPQASDLDLSRVGSIVAAVERLVASQHS